MEFVEFLDRLPQGSYYQSALMCDEDYAQQALAAHAERERRRKPGTAPEETPQSFVGYTREVELVTTLINALLINTNVTAGLAGGGSSHPFQMPTPRSRFAELVEKFDNNYADDLAARAGLS